MAGGYREQIVENDAQRLALARKRYELAWMRVALWRDGWPSWVLAVAFPGVTLAIVYWADGFAYILLPVGWALVFAGAFAGRRLLRRNCPRCGNDFFGEKMQRDQTECPHCDLPFGYLPTAEDLDAADESD